VAFGLRQQGIFIRSCAVFALGERKNRTQKEIYHSAEGSNGFSVPNRITRFMKH
jgi:hypothetical protein